MVFWRSNKSNQAANQLKPVTQTDGAVAFHNWTGPRSEAGWQADTTFKFDHMLEQYTLGNHLKESDGSLIESLTQDGGYYYEVQQQNNHKDNVGRPTQNFVVVYFEKKVPEELHEALRQALSDIPTSIDRTKPISLRLNRRGNSFAIDAQYPEGTKTITLVEAYKKYKAGDIVDERVKKGTESDGDGTRWRESVPSPKAETLPFAEEVQGPTPLEKAVITGLREAKVPDALIESATQSVIKEIGPFLGKGVVG